MVTLNQDEQRCLLELARQTIVAAVGGAALDLSAWSARLPSERLRGCAAAFVTLHRQGRLRGCVGIVRAVKPLYLTVADAAVSAALRDPRFEPVSEAELPQLKIEISLLSPFFPVRPEEVKPGEHGLMISQGFHRGLLLPCTAIEHGWDRESFLAETCAKAGLERDAWKEGALIEGFTAFVFSED